MGGGISCRIDQPDRETSLTLDCINGKELNTDTTENLIIATRVQAIVTKFEGKYNDATRNRFKMKIWRYLVTQSRVKDVSFDFYSGDWIGPCQDKYGIANGGEITYFGRRESLVNNLMILIRAVKVEVDTFLIRKQTLRDVFG